MSDTGTVLITGGSRGIGAATARLAAAAGHAVCLTYATQPGPAEALVEAIRRAGGRAACLQADVGDADVAETLLDRLPAELPSLGALVNNAGITGPLGAPGEYVHYAASKAAVEGFTVGLAKELAGQGIRVNAVSPGTTLTDIHAAAGGR